MRARLGAAAQAIQPTKETPAPRGVYVDDAKFERHNARTARDAMSKMLTRGEARLRLAERSALNRGRTQKKKQSGG